MKIRHLWWSLIEIIVKKGKLIATILHGLTGCYGGLLNRILYPWYRDKTIFLMGECK